MKYNKHKKGLHISNVRFAEELRRFKTENNISSIEKLLDKYNSELSIYNREAFSRFSNGSKKLYNDDIQTFSALFGIRPEYLSGIDDDRTEDDRIKRLKKEHDINESFRRLLINMGYADLYVSEYDNNITFPPNTYAFLTSIRSELEKTGINVLCDINRDTMVSLTDDVLGTIFNDIIDYIEFKLEKLFRYHSMPVPTVVLDDDTTLLQAHNEIEYLTPEGNTETMNFDINHVPTSQLSLDSLTDSIDLY